MLAEEVLPCLDIDQAFAFLKSGRVRQNVTIDDYRKSTVEILHVGRSGSDQSLRCRIEQCCLPKAITDAWVNMNGCDYIHYDQPEEDCKSGFMDYIGGSWTEHLHAENLATALFGSE